MSINRFFLFIFGLIVIDGCGVKTLHGQEQFPPLTGADSVVIGEAYHLKEALGEKIWPGWAMVSTPVVYVIGDYEYAIGFPRAMKGFTSLGDHPLLKKSVQVRERTLSPNLAASFSFEGNVAVIMGTPAVLRKSNTAWALTAVHEMFHVFQAAHGEYEKVAELKLGPESDASWQIKFPFPYKDSNVMDLIHLQSYPVYLALTDSDIDGVKYNAHTALEAIRIYKDALHRLDSINQYNKYSEFQQWKEGIAFYTEYKMAEAAANDTYQPADVFRLLVNYESYQEIWQSDYKNRLFLIKHAGRAAKSRTAFYHLGMGKGLLLDRLMPDWKTQYFLRGVWIDDLLMTALGASNGRLDLTIPLILFS